MDITKLSPSQQLAEFARLQSENEKLKKAAQPREKGKISFSVSEKGGVSVYGLQKWPVTLYPDQWMRLIQVAGELLDFIQANFKENKE
jgi:hypothetical protein